jgi:hypothetical protein
MPVSMRGLEGGAAPFGGEMAIENGDSLIQIGMEAWVEDEQGGWPAYLLSREGAGVGARLRWAGSGPVRDRVTFHLARGPSLYEWTTEATSLGGLDFSTPVPGRVLCARARCEERLAAPAQAVLRLTDGSERRVIDVSKNGLCFAVSCLTDRLESGDVVRGLLLLADRPALAVSIEVQHVSELGEDGPLAAGGTLQLGHPSAAIVWSRALGALASRPRAAIS